MLGLAQLSLQEKATLGICHDRDHRDQFFVIDYSPIVMKVSLPHNPLLTQALPCFFFI